LKSRHYLQEQPNVKKVLVLHTCKPFVILHANELFLLHCCY